MPARSVCRPSSNAASARARPCGATHSAALRAGASPPSARQTSSGAARSSAAPSAQLSSTLTHNMTAGQSEWSGRIAAGMRADLAALAIDPLQAAPDELADAPVVLKGVAGSVVHRDATVGV